MKIAITGNIGSGKSSVCHYLSSLGYDVFDCDETNRFLLKENQEGWLAVKENFPECFEKGVLDKKKLSALVFSKEEKRKELEEIMHPLILQKLLKREDDPLFAEVPLLFEVNWDIYFDQNVLVVTDREILIDRLVNRGIEKEEALLRLDAQMSIEEKIKRADKIIYNNGSLKDLYKAVDDWLDEIT